MYTTYCPAAWHTNYVTRDEAASTNQNSSRRSLIGAEALMSRISLKEHGKLLAVLLPSFVML